MYYLAKFCRICIRSDVDLVDLETEDEDGVTFGEKLTLCTKMVNKQCDFHFVPRVSMIFFVTGY